MKLVQVASNITTALEFDEGGEAVVTKSYERKGWVLLQDLYRQEGRMDLWKAWEDHRAAILAARKDGLSIAGFPDKYLPREVHRRRAGHRPESKAFSLPDLPAVDLSEPEVEASPAPRKGRPPKAQPQEG
ncbi:hypothetical protein [Nannocystis sp. SCPEA4]|uniref:hypothetical protein n=1 Tax=Nannocystis sp. SCPEA4 TaxID=2996787 RepID=UPI00226E943D|nr:hypothetical protein [Nannocystis sp. SCPEA4]MCY1055433.1 hypothetical protein [Nannocystis sp. SCPEA4]